MRPFHYSPLLQSGLSFNPRTPRGGATRYLSGSSPGYLSFNPRTPRGGATGFSFSLFKSTLFQSTHPARGCDAMVLFLRHSPDTFNPRTPRGGATLPRKAPAGRYTPFNPRTPRGGATGLERLQDTVSLLSIHAPREGVRRQCQVLPRRQCRFQSTHPARGCDLSSLA